MFDEWCEILESEEHEDKTLIYIWERAGGRAAIRNRPLQTVRNHYQDLQHLAEDISELGFPAASEALRVRMPTRIRTRSGELAEIIATEFIEFHTQFRIPVRRGPDRILHCLNRRCSVRSCPSWNRPGYFRPRYSNIVFA